MGADPAAVARAMLARDRATQQLQMSIVETGPGRAKLEMQVRDDMLNGHDLCHGGLLFTLADSAFAYASNSCNRSTVAAQCQITFVRPAKRGDVLVADCAEVSRGKSSGVYDVTVTRRQDDKLIALFRGYAREVGGAVLDDEKQKEQG